MRHNTTRGGKRRGEPKVLPWYQCPLCTKKVSRRKSRQVDGPKEGEKVRVCKTHNVG
jgi:hypothetical protein